MIDYAVSIDFWPLLIYLFVIFFIVIIIIINGPQCQQTSQETMVQKPYITPGVAKGGNPPGVDFHSGTFLPKNYESKFKSRPNFFR